LFPRRQLQQEQLWHEWMELAWAKLDTNGDGYISLDEIVAKLPPPVDGEADETAEERIIAVRLTCTHACTAYIGTRSRMLTWGLVHARAVWDT
jgi:hypothetical protein